MILVILLVITALAGVGMVIGTSIADFSQDIPRYEYLLTTQSNSLIDWLRVQGVRVPEGGVSAMIDAGKIFELVGGLLSSIASMLGDGLLILFTVLFILLEASTFSAKYAAMFGDNITASESRQKFLKTVKNYFIMKTGISLASRSGGWCLPLDPRRRLSHPLGVAGVPAELRADDRSTHRPPSARIPRAGGHRSFEGGRGRHRHG